MHLKKGIHATKLNWSDNKHKDILLSLTSDSKSFFYKRSKGDSTSWEKLKGHGKVKLKDIAEITYGPISSTF